MITSLSQFHGNLKRARDLAALGENLAAQTTVALDCSDIFRASLVLAVSALDHFIHEIARKGMLEIATGKRAPTDAYRRFNVSMLAVSTLLGNPGQFQALEFEIRERHGFLSFQDPKKISDALRLISPVDLWSEVGNLLGQSNSTIKGRLKIIIDRRNQIAHEADMDPTAPGARWPIDAIMVTDAITILEKIAVSIYNVVN